MEKYFLQIGLFLMLSQLLPAQGLMNSEEKINQVITYQRDKTLRAVWQIREEYAEIIKEVKESDLSISKKKEVLGIVKYIPQSRTEKYIYGKLEKVLFKRKYQGELLKRFKKSEGKFVAINKLLSDLNNLRVLKKNLEIDSTHQQNLVSEISFYNFHDDQKIAEIGAGRGNFSFLISKIYEFEKIYINELKSGFVKQMKGYLKNNQEEKNVVKTVKGSTRSIKLKGKKVDKIIIRNTYYHFSKKDKMLVSIKESLAKNGKLYLLEPVRELDGHKKECPNAISKKEILIGLKKNGFILTKEKVSGNCLLMEFQIKD